MSKGQTLLSNTDPLESLPEAVIVADDDAIIRYGNSRAGLLLGCDPAEVRGRTLWDIGLDEVSLPDDSSDRGRVYRASVYTTGQRLTPVEIETARASDGLLTVLVLRDMTRYQRSELQLSVQRDVLDLMARHGAIDQVGERLVEYLKQVLPGQHSVCYLYEHEANAFTPIAGPAETDTITEHLTAVQRAIQFTHLPRIRGSGASEFIDADGDEAIASHPDIQSCWCYSVVPASGAYEGAICLLQNHPDPPTVEEQRLIDSATDLFRIALDRVQLDREMQNQRFNDELTGLPNRVLLLDRLDQALQRAAQTDQRVALLLIDLDRLQMVNDSLGYQAGDELLRKAAERLRNLIRASDLVARFIGDEFGVLLEHIDNEEDAINVVMRIQRAFAVPLKVGGVDVFATLSIGVALSDGRELDADAMLRHADTAMYRARDDGRGQFAVYSSSQDLSPVPKIELQSRLYRALAANALQLHYQPLVSLRDGSVVGYEALLRWHDEQYGDIPPDEFLPLAQQSGIMAEITAWVLDRAVWQTTEWQLSSGAELTVSVNVSPAELNDPLLIEQVDAVLKRYQLPPVNLTLELTEHGLMDITGRGRKILERLRELGVAIALDDFGTGFSSLSYLEQLPVDCIKIDRTFIQSARGGVSRAPVAAAMVDLARNLGMTSVAEGIEIEEDERIARRLGCDLSQGYFYARPRPGSTSTRWGE